MGRIRTIKPEFWTDSFMVQLPPLARLLYIALWTAADDHGYLRDEPERIAMEVMPREQELQVDDYIQLFIASGRLETFASENGETYLRISRWEDHQRVDKPSKSRISREGSRKFAIPTETRRKVAEKYGCQPGEEVDAICYYCGAEGKIHWHKLFSGRPSAWVTFPGLELDHLEAEFNGGGKGPDNMVLACRLCNRHKGTKSWLEIISSRNFANVREPSREERKGKEQGKDKDSYESSSPTSVADCPHQRIIDAYEETLPMLPRVRRDMWAGSQAAEYLKARWREDPKRQDVGWWRKLFERIRDRCPHLLGHSNVNPNTGKVWHADLRWIVKRENFTKILEGRYLDRNAA